MDVYYDWWMVMYGDYDVNDDDDSFSLSTTIQISQIIQMILNEFFKNKYPSKKKTINTYWDCSSSK